MSSNSLEISPDSFAAVMATGILSVAAKNHRYSWVSVALCIVASLALIVLVVIAVIVTVAKRRAVPWDMKDPQVTMALFTFVAACAVLCNRIASGHPLILPVLGSIAGLAWLVLAPVTVRNLSKRGLTELRDEVHGAWLLASVATSGLAIVTAKLAANSGLHQWLIAATAIWVLALAIYVVLATLMVWRAIAERLDRDGFEPDTWILMGSLAIAVVAGHDIHQQARGGLASSVHAVTVLAWAVASLWIPPLIYFGLHRVEERPRLLRFTGAWWTLVFPLGMYSAATYRMADEIQARSLQTVALVFFWIAMVVWLIVAVAGLMRIPQAIRAIGSSGTQGDES